MLPQNIVKVEYYCFMMELLSDRDMSAEVGLAPAR